VGGVDDAPAVVDRGAGEEMLHRAGAGGGQAVFDFSKLLGDVDVQHAAAGQRHKRGQLGCGGGAQSEWGARAEARVGRVAMARWAASSSAA